MSASWILIASLCLTAQPPAPPGPPPAAPQIDPAWKPLGRSLWFDPQQKDLILRARVALREGALEHLLCLEQTKEHESILATDAAPRTIHAGLLLTGVEPGHPVRFQPKFAPPAGPPIGIELQWIENGQTRHADARSWVKDARDDSLLKTPWVFAGSELYPDPETGKPHYAADSGDLFTVANFPASILDLPFASSADDADRLYVANTSAIPPRGTPVLMILHPAGTPRANPPTNPNPPAPSPPAQP